MLTAAMFQLHAVASQVSPRVVRAGQESFAFGATRVVQIAERSAQVTLPQAPEMVIASPCSGHGFKFGMLIGAILAELATTGTTRYPIDHLRAQRLLGPPSRPGGDG